MIVFSDYECPFCRQFATETWPGIATEFGESISLVIRHWPLGVHENAYLAARASECAAAQGRFDAFNAEVFSKEAELSLAGLISDGASVGIPDTVAFARCVRNEDPQPLVEAGIADAKQLGLRGTPSVIINGVLLPSASLARIRAKVSELLHSD